MSRETGAMMRATIYYEGEDSDGVVRDGAFRTRVGVLHAHERGEITSENSRFIVAFFSTKMAELTVRIGLLRKINSSIPIYVVGEPIESPDIVMHLVNDARIRGWIARDPTEIEKAIRECLDENEKMQTYLKSRRELGTRNRQLHDLQENLEKIVSERTSYLSDAEHELHRRTQNTRELVRFIKELSHTESIEEILVLLSQEVRSFHEVRAPILAAVSPEFGARLHFQQVRTGGSGRTSSRSSEKGWGSKPVKKIWPHRLAIKIGDIEDQMYLAQELGRPVARTISIPLGRDQRAQSTASETATPLLIFEHSFDESKSEKFKRFLVSRIEPLSTALDRIIINRETRAASRLWEATFDGIADPIAVIGSGFEVLRMNEAFAKFTSPKHRLCYEVFANRSSPCDGCRLREVVSGASHLDWQVRRSASVYAVTGYPIHFELGLTQTTETVRSVIHHYSDVTKSLELKGHAFQGEKMAAIGLMAGNIAHELNNPLAGLRALAQVLSVESEYPISVKDDLKAIETAAERSSAIIRDLLDFSRADDRVREKVSINEIAERSLNMVKTALHDHRVDTQWADALSVMIEVDPHLLQHVIFNIVNNACQAMREPGEIQIRTTRKPGREGSSDQVEIEVVDSGPGISPEILRRVFEPFFTTKAAGQGTGLGLSMSRWIVENFGGEIEVANRSDRSGTIFTVRLPAAQEPRVHT